MHECFVFGYKTRPGENKDINSKFHNILGIFSC